MMMMKNGWAVLEPLYPRQREKGRTMIPLIGVLVLLAVTIIDDTPEPF